MRLLLTVADRRQRSQIVKVLKSSGVRDIVNSGEGVWATATGGSDPADAVVAVLSGPRDKLASVFLDIGFAHARNNPLLVLSDEPSFSELLPDVTILHGGLKNASALKFHLDTFLESVRRPLEEVTLPAGTQAVSTDWAVRELHEVRANEDRATRAELFEQLVEHLLRTAEANVFAHDRYGPGQFDFAASVPGTDFGPGPIAVECRSVETSQALASAARKLQSAVIERGAALGVLNFDDAVLASPSRVKPVPMVIMMGIDELMQGLQAKSLGRVLSDARNRAVHAL
jgi:hypothetical protein